MDEDRRPRDVVARLMDGYLSTQLLYVAARLGVADLLRDGPRSSAELATATGAAPSALRRVLRGLVVHGVLDEDADGCFFVTEAGRWLESGRTDSIRDAVLARGDLYYQAAGALIQTVRHGGAAFRHAHGVDFFDAIAARPDRGAAFQASMTARSRQEAQEVARVYDFTPFTHIVDVGGGHGVLLAAILGRLPHARGTLFDRPDVVAGALRHDPAEVASRCELAAGDFFAHVPAGGDLYLLSRVVHDWDDADATRILTACRRAMPGRGVLLLVEAVLPDRARDLPAAVLMDLNMLTLLNGRERTRPEFERLLDASGFDLRRVLPVEGRTGVTVLEAQARAADAAVPPVPWDG